MLFLSMLLYQLTMFDSGYGVSTECVSYCMSILSVLALHVSVLSVLAVHVSVLSTECQY